MFPKPAPELAVVVESPVSEARMHAMFAALNELLGAFAEIGAYKRRFRRRRHSQGNAGTLGHCPGIPEIGMRARMRGCSQSDLFKVTLIVEPPPKEVKAPDSSGR